MNGPETMEHALGPTADPTWVLDADGYDPLRESSVESRFAISNGFLGIRGARATTRGARWIVPPRNVCGRAVRHVGHRGDHIGAGPGRRLAAGPHSAAGRASAASPWRCVVASHDTRFAAGRIAQRFPLENTRTGHPPPAHVAPRVFERARGWAAADPNGDRKGRYRDHFRNLVRRSGPRARIRETRTGSRRLAHAQFRQGPRHGDRIVAADRRPRSTVDRARPIEMVVELEISSWAGRVFRTFRRRGAERHPGSGPSKRGAGQARRFATTRLARRGRGARGGLDAPLAVQRRRGRRRCGRATGIAVRSLPFEQRGQPGRRARLNRCPGADWRRLSWTCVLGHGNLPAPLLYPDLARSGPGAAHVSLPHSRRRAGKGGPDGLARCILRLGVHRYRRRDGTGAGYRSGSTGHPYPLRQAGAAHYRGHRLRGLAILAGDRG